MWITLLSLSFAATPGEHLQTHATGPYVLASSEAQTVAIAEAAVDAYLASEGFLTRRFTRERLVAAALPCARYDLALEGSLFSIWCDDAPVIIAKDGGDSIPYTAPNGNTYDVSVTFEETELSLEFEGEEASQTTTYRFSESGNLLLQREIRPVSLGGSLVIFYTYSKAP